MKQTNISIYIEGKSKELIEEARNIVGLNRSSFCRVASIKEAREILNKNKQVVQNAGATTI